MKNIDLNTGLKASHKEQIISIIRANAKVKQLWLFGSRAKGTYQANSDIDLAIEGDALSLTDLAHIMDKLESTSIPYKIDVLIKEKITNPALLEQIKSHAVRWF